MASLPDYLIGRRELLQRGEVKRREVHRFNLIDDLAVDLGCVAHFHPVRIFSERVEGSFCRLFVFMCEQIDEFWLGAVLRYSVPVHNVGHTVFLEQLARVVAESRL